MKAEAHRHGNVTRRLDDRGDAQPRPAQRDLHAQHVREGERRQQLRGRKVEACVQARATRVNADPLELPSTRGRQQPMDRQPMLLRTNPSTVARQLDAPPTDLIAPPREPVRPRVQQRNPGRRAARGVSRRATGNMQKLIAKMRKQRPKHPRAGNERRTDPRLRRAQLNRLEPIDGRLASTFGHLHAQRLSKAGAAAAIIQRSWERATAFAGGVGSERASGILA